MVMCVLAEAVSGMVLKFEIQEPEEDAVVSLAEDVAGFILQNGAPKEIRVSNVLIETGLEQICKVCGIRLRIVKRLESVEDFKEGMMRFM